MTVTPIIIPVHTEPERCPHCRQNLVEVTICNACKKELPEEEGGPFGFLLVLLVTLFVVLPALFAFAAWVLFPIMNWIIEHSPGI
jgi:uncharacterized protein (DUF983 family)